MHVRELRHRVADRLVDVAGDLAAHRVRERDVHVRRGERGGHRLEAVADRDHDVGLEALERGRQLEQPETRGLGHRPGRLSLDQHEDPLVGLEAVRLDQVEHGAVAVEQRGGADNELQRQLRVLADRAHCGLDARVIRSRADHDADLPHAISSSVTTVSAAMSLRAVRPTTSSMRAAGMPVPGFFAASISRVIVAPAGMCATATTDFSKTRFISANGWRSSLSTGFASIVSMSRIPSTSSSNSSGSVAKRASAPYISRESVKCFSTTEAPSTTAANAA